MLSLGPLSRANLLIAEFTVLLAMASVYPRPPQNSDTSIKGVQVGQLFVTPLAVGTISPSPAWGLPKPPKKGYHFVVVNVRVQNTTLYRNCTEWNTKIMTDAAHKYGNQLFRAPDPPDVEHLPFRAQTEGTYAFQVRDGESPVGLSLERLYEVERLCWNSKRFVPAEPFTATVNIPLDGLPEPTARLYPIKSYPTQEQQSSTQKNTYTLAERNAYQAEHNESNPLLKIGLIDSFITRYPNSALLANFYLDAVQTYYYQLHDYPNTIKYADKLLALGDQVNPTSQEEIQRIRADSEERMKQ